MKKIKKESAVSEKTELLHGLYLDIETTGLSKSRSIITVIGCLIITPGQGTLLQWFNDDAISEEAMLRDFYEFLSQYQGEATHPSLITFNGQRFDLPYLATHLSYHDLSSEVFDSFPTIDLYQKLLPFQRAFGLEHGRQKDWEQILSIPREDIYSGKEVIRIYKDYLKTKDDAASQKILLHNEEDLYGLLQLSSLSSLFQILQEEWKITDITPGANEQLQISCEVAHTFPVTFSLGDKIKFENHHITILLPYVTGTMKHFYPDYKNYYYLIEEDYAVHKSIGRFVESSHRKKATAATCYKRQEGIFFPLPDSVKKYGLRVSLEPYNHLPSYRRDFDSKTSYLELDDIMQKNETTYPVLVQYLRDMMIILLLV